MTRPLNETKFVPQAAHIRPSGHTWSRIKTSRLARVLSSPTGVGPVHPSPTGIGPVYPCRSMESRSSVEILNGEPKRSEMSSLSTTATYSIGPTNHLSMSSSSSGGREVYQESTKNLKTWANANNYFMIVCKYFYVSLFLIVHLLTWGTCAVIELASQSLIVCHR